MDDSKFSAHWYAVYVKSRYEKKSAGLLERDGHEVYLPLITRVKQWSDRRKKVEEPLFKSYIFVHIDMRVYFNVLNTPGIVKFVCFEGKPVEMPDNQILAIKEYIGQTETEGEQTLPKDLQVGQLVMIKNGPMRGLQGHLTTILGKQYVIVNIEVVGQSLPITVPRKMLEIVSE